jgi:hypothetical protein
MKILQLGFIAPEANHFRPLITYSEPSLTIDSEMFVASEDATSGSVIANADRICPLISGSSHSLRCHSLPNMERTSMLPVSGAAQFVAVGAILGERPMISASGAYCRLVRPAPCSPGRNRFHRPRLRASSLRSSISGGLAHPLVAAWASKASSAGYTHSSMKSSSRPRSFSVSASNAKSMGPPQVSQERTDRPVWMSTRPLF